MNFSTSNKVLVVIIVLQGVFLYSLYQDNQQFDSKLNALEATNTELVNKLRKAEEGLALAEQSINDMEKRSIEGMLRETNKAVVSGWQLLLDTVQGELSKAKESIPELIEELEDATKSLQADPNSAPDGSSSEDVVPGERT